MSFFAEMAPSTGKRVLCLAILVIDAAEKCLKVAVLMRLGVGGCCSEWDSPTLGDSSAAPVLCEVMSSLVV